MRKLRRLRFLSFIAEAPKFLCAGEKMAKTFIICEKPSAAAKVAAALADGKVAKKELNGAPYYEFERDGKQILVSSALGHLFTLKNLRPMKDYPVYDIDWVPTYKVDKKAARTEPFIEAIKELSKGADEFISATDYDTEGAVIGYNVLRFLCGEDSIERAKRMKFSTLTAQDLRRAYENLSPRLDFELIDSGIARHVLDWYWGINVSKAMSAAVESAQQRFAKLSAGRVQTPTLRILAEREQEIRAFRPEPFWIISLLFEFDGQEVVAEHVTPRFFDKKEAEKVRDACEGKKAKVSAIQTRKYQQQPPIPFDLGALQAEAYRCFGYTPMRTQQIAQQLYDAAYISYPRTSNQKFPPTIDLLAILKHLRSNPRYKKLVDKLFEQGELRPTEGSKTDPAHPPIHPTGERPTRLSGPQQRLYDLIVRRFLSIFGRPALKESIKVELDVNGQRFYLRGRNILDEGWLEYYAPFVHRDEVDLPKLIEDQELVPKELRFEEKETQPPPRYNPASIIKAMEEKNLGTKATRAPILQTLYERGYIFGNQIVVTDIGMEVVNSLSKHCPEIVSEDLTAHFESEMEKIQEGKRSKDEVIAEAREKLDEILRKFKEKQEDIGKDLGDAYAETKRKQRVLGTCAKCGGELRVIVSRATHKRFVGCSNYPNCKNAFPLPQTGFIIPLDKKCEHCGAPMIQVNRAGMRPYKMCLEPKCKSKEEWGNRKAAMEKSEGEEES
jgi:DNA topoisomerase-1